MECVTRVTEFIKSPSQSAADVFCSLTLLVAQMLLNQFTHGVGIVCIGIFSGNFTFGRTAATGTMTGFDVLLQAFEQRSAGGTQGTGLIFQTQGMNNIEQDIHLLLHIVGYIGTAGLLFLTQGLNQGGQ